MAQNDAVGFDDNPSSAFGTFSPHEGRRVSVAEILENMKEQPST